MALAVEAMIYTLLNLTAFLKKCLNFFFYPYSPWITVDENDDTFPGTEKRLKNLLETH